MEQRWSVVTGHPYVAVRHSRNHNSPVGVADRRPPWGLQSKREKAKVEVEVQNEV
jgi:hypothetical protein